ncbi:MAG: aminotransferase class I/II-fold pyridoxal phosphate-dependent enzyme, partial [Spirochaetaceae bacterium]|nr:aminotransferase class I/II-fold pyridoxal phosphate-dependent enzyme [Spirochaetaceae bacterium]
MHGGLNLSELRALGLRPDQVLDFSASINLLGASPLVREALQRVDLAAYPDPDCRDLREALSQQLGLEVDDIPIGNGATELIHLIARSVLRQGDAAAILAPTFGEFEAACRLQGVAPVQIAPADHRTFRWDLQAGAPRSAPPRPPRAVAGRPPHPTSDG